MRQGPVVRDLPRRLPTLIARTASQAIYHITVGYIVSVQRRARSPGLQRWHHALVRGHRVERPVADVPVFQRAILPGVLCDRWVCVGVRMMCVSTAVDQYHSCCSIPCGDKLAAQMLLWAQANSDSIK